MKHPNTRLAGLLVAAMSLSGCAPAVMAPTVPVMPGEGKSPGAFAADQAVCQQYAQAQIAPLQAQASNQAIGSAVIGTALGAGLGAAIGGGRGAAIGAAGGAIAGTGVAAANAQMAGMTLQQQYNIYFSQCMYGRGNQVPGFEPREYGLRPYPGTPVPPPPPPG